MLTMKQALTNLLVKIIPFILLGIALVFAAIGIIVFSYIFIIGAIVGLILFVIAYIWMKIQKARGIAHPIGQSRRHLQENGRTIDHEK